MCEVFYGQCYNLIIIYYSSPPRVTVMHASDANSKNRFVSHLQIRHMVYTDTGEYHSPELCQLSNQDFYLSHSSWPGTCLQNENVVLKIKASLFQTLSIGVLAIHFLAETPKT